MGKKLLLIDGHSMAYRAFFALPVDAFTTASGQHTNAVYGFSNMLMTLIKDEKPTHVAVAFDVSRKTFRTEKFPEYKATRSATPDEFRSQIPLIHEALKAMNINEYSLEGFEADDLLATISKRAVAEDFEVAICTGDRDSFQLVTEKITVLYPKKGVSEMARMTPDAVVEKYGLTPAQYPDFAALRGDPSDNLPSIPGVGEKTAAKWIIEYGSFSNLVKKIDEIGGKVGDSLRANIDSAIRNRELTQLISEAPINFNLTDMNWNGFNYDALREIFAKLEFRSLIAKLPAKAESVPEAVDIKFSTPEEVSAKLQNFTGTLGFLFELLDERLSSYAVAISPSEVYLVMSDEIGPWLADPNIQKISHDFKSLARTMEFNGVVFDTSLASYLVDPGNRLTEIDEILERWGLTDASLSAKAGALFSLRDKLTEELSTRNALKLLIDLEIPVSQSLSRMERFGVAIDKKVLKAQSEELQKEVAKQSQIAFEAAGHEFNVASPKQLQVVLFDELKLPKTKKIKTGYTTDAESLQWLFSETKHPVLEALLKIREASKLQSVIEGLLGEIAADNRIHTHFQQTVAATGRLSSTGPNLQNIPIRTEAGKKIRDGFIAGEGFDGILTADYSQIEMRILAHLAEDKKLLEAFASGEDLHSTVASLVFGVKGDEVTPDMRRQIKAMSYGLAYGLTAFGLSQQLDITPGEASALMENYYKRFGGIRDYLATVVVEAKKVGYTETLLGRRRYLPDLQNENKFKREIAERAALNAPIQGTAADIIKLAMLRVDQAMKAANLKSRLLLQIHDELLFEYIESELEELKELVKQEMGAAYPLKAPLSVNIGYGKSWHAAEH
ncbi:MAG: DNA polymerase I [Candidatus Nanopelagicaceae bacterium]|nr:DNA polymerase I [Candidatus Nanopelagicaceae bacterium]